LYCCIETWSPGEIKVFLARDESEDLHIGGEVHGITPAGKVEQAQFFAQAAGVMN